MGQEASSPIDESVPPRTLESRTIDGVAKYIKAGKAKRIVVMSGAGISTSAGIPDFRSPDTGLYANLARLNLPYAEAVFDISFFQRDPVPFYTLAKDLYPGRYRPTLAHSFIRLLSDKQLLLKAFTQNIDCLEREAGVPGDAIVEAHGSFATSSCTRCKAPFPSDRMRELVAAGTVARCGADGAACGGLVKPDIVFFGEALPDAFFRNRALPQAADLAIVMGTSLTVQPFASLPSFVPDGVPRVLINKERVGDLGCRADDVLVLGEADEGVRKLADACGWGEELRRLWEATASKEEREGKGEASRDLEDKVLEKEKSRDELLEEEVEKLTRDVDETLKLGETTRDWARGGLDKEEKEGKEEIGQAAAAADKGGQLENVEKIGAVEKSEGLAPAGKTEVDGGGTALKMAENAKEHEGKSPVKAAGREGSTDESQKEEAREEPKGPKKPLL